MGRTNKRNLRYTKAYLEPFARTARSVSEMCTLMGLAPHGSSHCYVRNRLTFFGIDTGHFVTNARRGKPAIGRLSHDKVLVFARLKSQKESGARLRRALIEFGRPVACEECASGELWNGKPLRLQVDHLDGNPLNNEPSNLRFLCPNCHSQTPNFGILNAKKKRAASPGQVRATPRQRTKVQVQVDCSFCGSRFGRKPSTVRRTKNYCSYSCAAAGSERAVWPIDNDLKDAIWQKPAMIVAKELGVSPSALKKRCKVRSIETPPRGYWARARAKAA